MKRINDAAHAGTGSCQASEQYGVSDMRWSKRSSMGLALLGMTCVGSHVQAAPEGGQVVAGSANIVQSQVNRLDVVQQSERAAINWQSFGIGASEHVNFEQPSTQSATLNRVTGPDLSSIQGRMTANGNVFLVNPNGILFGKNAKIDVGGLVASTANISDQDFMAGRYSFKEPSKRASMIVNEGEINVSEGGLVALVAPGVENSGTITARMGRVTLASGDAFTLDLYGDKLVSLAVDDSVLEGLTDSQGNPVAALVNQTGTIQAEGGEVLLTAAEAQAAVDKVINMSGVIETQSVGQENGEIVLYGGPEGGVDVAGILDASGKDSGESGGTVRVLGDEVALRGGAEVDVSGDTGGGTVLIGGDFQGHGSTPRASHTVVEQGATVVADAFTRGNGGEVIVWADGSTDFQGHISAKGGIESGDGGFVEVSGKEGLNFRGDVDASAPNGQAGTVLFDPTNLNIGVGEDVEPFTIARMLQRGTSVVQSASNDISVNGRIDGRGGASGAGLTLTAGHDVTINNDILTNNGPIGITAQSGSIAMGPGPADSITGGTGTFLFSGSADISLTANGNVNVQHLLTSGDVNIASNAGSVSLLQDLGGSATSNSELGSLTLNAATKATLKQLRTDGAIAVDASDIMQDGQIISGGPVTLSAPSVTLKHSIFTSDQHIVLGQLGGMVVLDPAGDELTKDFAEETDEEIQLKQGNTGGQIGESEPLDVDVMLTTRQITLDTGPGSGDIELLGEVDIPLDSRNLRDPTLTFVADENSDFESLRIPKKELEDFFYVSLSLSAGSGNILFRGGIGSRADPSKGVGVVKSPPPQQNIGGSTNTVDLVIVSAAGVNFGDGSFVNSCRFANVACNAGAPVSGKFQEIFHRFISVEAGSSLPPIFPEPQLPGRFGPTRGGGALGLPLAQALAIASTVEETQRERDTACGEGAAGGEGEGGGDACAPTAEAEGEELYAIESGPKEADPAQVDEPWALRGFLPDGYAPSELRERVLDIAAW